MQKDRIVPSVVVWDVGGTLMDRISHADALEEILRLVGVRPDLLDPHALQRANQWFQEAEPTWRTLHEEARGFQQIAALMLAETGYATSVRIEQLGTHLANSENVYFLVPGIRGLLQELSALNLRQAIVSNWPPSLARILTSHGLASFFCVVVGSGEEGILKPDPVIFHRALDRLNISPHEAVYVGNDPDLDILPARRLGMQAIHFDPRQQYTGADAYTVEELRKRLFEMLDVI